MFKPRKVVNRRKKLEDENGVDMDIEDDHSSPVVTVKSTKKKKKKTKPATKGLSFADDDPSEESVDFKVKKSSRLVVNVCFEHGFNCLLRLDRKKSPPKSALRLRRSARKTSRSSTRAATTAAARTRANHCSSCAKRRIRCQSRLQAAGSVDAAPSAPKEHSLHSIFQLS